MNEEVEVTLRLSEDLYTKLLEVANLSSQSVEVVARVILTIVVLEGVEDDSTDA